VIKTLPIELSVSDRQRFRQRVDIPINGDGCWTFSGARNQNGYGQFRIGERRVNQRVNAHRVAWVLENGPIPDGLLVCHKCDQPSCVRPSHLWLGTSADNQADMSKKGRSTTGEKSGKAKLRQRDVLAIRRLAAGGRRHSTIADRYRIATGYVSQIVWRKSWQHLPPEPGVATPVNGIIGEAHWCAKLTEQDVRTIRQLVARGDTQTDVARRFGVSTVSVSKIIRGRTWKHVPR
jgi:hypothetical protein